MGSRFTGSGTCTGVDVGANVHERAIETWHRHWRSLSRNHRGDASATRTARARGECGGRSQVSGAVAVHFGAPTVRET
jgi:hypothetical protein